MDSLYDIPFPHPRHSPTKAEILSSKTSIGSLEPEIESIQQKIKELQARLQPLQRKRNNHASYISPLRRLPPEILSSIIQICLVNGASLLTLTQICGTIRDVVHGMTTIWSKIALTERDPYGYYVYGWISCRTAGQLDAILSRAGGTPLDISIGRETDLREWQLLVSHRCPIRSLTINYQETETLTFDLDRISLRDLRCLSFVGVPFRIIEKVMDLALESTQEEMDIQIHSSQRVTAKFLKHDLLRRASKFGIGSLAHESVKGTKHVYPHLRKLYIDGEPELFQAFDITQVQSLQLCSEDDTTLLATFLPIHLTELHLRDVQITSGERPNQAHCLPQLTSLKLEYIEIQGTLSQYLKLPKLRHLDLDTVTFSPSDNEVESADESQGGASVERPDLVFLQGFLGLNTLSFANMPVDGLIVERIKLYPQLYSLITICNENFIPSFLGALDDKSSFPALSWFQMESYWDRMESMSCKDFIELCAIKRPYMNIFNNTIYRYSKDWLRRRGQKGASRDD